MSRNKRTERNTSSCGAGSSRSNSQNQTNLLKLSDTPDSPSISSNDPRLSTELPESYTLFNVVSGSKPIFLSVVINNCPITMEFDTGGSVSVISESTFNSVLKDTGSIEPTGICLCTYMGQELPVLGTTTINVRYGSQTTSLPLVVVKGDGASLFGRNWLEHIKFNWSAIHSVSNTQDIEDILKNYQQLFRKELGTLKGMEAQIHVPPKTQPRYFKPRPLPYSLKAKVEKELERLQETGVITPVQFSDWAAPIVPVVKSDGSIRICGDYSVTVNAVSRLDNYLLPRVEDLFTVMTGGNLFSKLDLTQAYQQLLLAEDSKKYTTINTTKGLFQYQRLPFGISSAPAIFQRSMDSLLQDLPGVVVYLDDVLVTGSNKDEHLRNLERVMNQLQSVGVSLKQSKCVFLAPSVEYLGHIIDKDGLHPEPRNLSELKSFLGLINYYSKFMSNPVMLLSPLYRLLQKDSKWLWTTEHSELFNQA